MSVRIEGQRRHAKGSGLLVAALALSLAPGAAAQVHVERSQDGKILITDQARGGTQIYTDAGSAPNWRHKDGRLEIWQPSRKDWIQAPEDYPMVASSGGLIFGYGPGSSGSAVFDLSRKYGSPSSTGTTAAP